MKFTTWRQFTLFVCAILLTGCVSSVPSPANKKALPTEKELDANSINDLSNTDFNTGVQGFEGISGRHVAMILIALDDMNKNHAWRCRAEPLQQHIFFYQEEDDVVIVQTAPRFVPDDRPPPGPGFINPRDFFNLPEKARGVPGCEIRFTIDKATRKVTDTYIIR